MSDTERRQKLAEEYKALIGYDPFEDDPTISEDEVEQTLTEFKAEIEMQTQYWAKRGKKQVGPFATRDAALDAFRTAYPFTKALYLATAKANEILTGYGTFGPQFDMRWHPARDVTQ